ncbi:hypothetical protein MAR_026972, partial [Mya arenaria]
VQSVFCVQTPSMTDAMYHSLSSKIDTMNFEMALIRKEQLQTKQELREAKDEIAKLRGLQVDTINLELAEVRHEQGQTKQDLIQAKTEIKTIREHQNFDESDTKAADDLTDAQGDASTSSVINSIQKEFQNEKAQTKNVLDQMKTDVALIRSDLNTVMATVKNDIKKVNDTLARAESIHASYNSLSAAQRHTDDTMSLLEKGVQSLKLSVSGINASLEEKCQSGEFGPNNFRPRPTFPWLITIHFQPAFRRTPAIVYGLRFLDVSNEANVRVRGEIMELTNTYFKFKIDEWDNTVLYGAKFSWMACPK